MPTNLAIDDNLIEEARKVGHHRTKKEAVTAALDEYIRKRKQLNVIEMFGKIDYDENYDYKRERDRNSKHPGKLHHGKNNRNKRERRKSAQR